MQLSNCLLNVNHMTCSTILKNLGRAQFTDRYKVNGVRQLFIKYFKLFHLIQI